MTLSEAAQRLAVSRTLVERWLAEGLLDRDAAGTGVDDASVELLAERRSRAGRRALDTFRNGGPRVEAARQKLRELRERLEHEAIARQLAERDAADTGERYTLREVAEEFGIDLDEL